MPFYRLLLLMTAFVIFALGLLMIFSTTSAEVLDHALNKSTHQALFRQMLYAIAGAGLALIVRRVGYQKILAYSPMLLAVSILLLVLVLIPGIGREVNGSKRWLGIAGFSFQPSEFVKYVVPAYVIHRYLQYQPETFTFKEFLKLIGIVAIPMVLIMVEPNNGTTFVIGMTVLILFLLMNVPAKFWAVPLLVFALVGGVFAYNLSYVSARLKVYMNPELDLKGKGHQPYQAKIAAGSGQFFGRGPGNSLQKLSYLPEAQNDYIAAIYAEEFGFMGIMILISLYLCIAFAGFSIAWQSKAPEAMYYASAITFLVCFQAFLNLGVVSGLLPSTGLNLPLFSQGGTSLMANIMGLSIVFQISREDLKHC